MNGSDLHEKTIEEIDTLFRRGEISTARQVLVIGNGHRGFIDLVAFPSTGPIAIEIELTPARVDRDRWKAMLLPAAQLWIVVPCNRVKARINRRLKALGVPENDFLSTFTIPQVLKAVTTIEN